jgi:ketosteroid isomerase-like protein
MSQENVELVRNLYGGLASEGVEGLLSFIHPEFEGTTPTDLAIEPDVYRGRDGVRRYFDSFSGAMDDIHFEGHRFHDAGDRVVVEMTLKARGKATGIEVGQPGFQVWEIRDRQVVRLENFATLDQALEAAGLSE